MVFVIIGKIMLILYNVNDIAKNFHLFYMNVVLSGKF